MFNYIFKRLILSVLTIIIALTITFFLLKLINKTPSALEAKITATMAANKNLTIPQATKNVFEANNYHPEWGAFEAYGHYVSDLFHGSFGAYYEKPQKSIPTQFVEPLKYTFLVSGLGFMFGTILGLAFGIYAGYKRGKFADITLNIFSILFVAIPSFVLAAILIVTANKTDWPTQFSPILQSGSMGATLKTLVLPILIITVTSFATITYYVRNEVVEVLKSDYVATARSKGLSEYNIFMSHVMRNISIPAITIIFPSFIFIVMGSLIIELFFSVPGTAKMFSTAITNYEYNVIMYSILFFASLSLVVNILVDVFYTILDPRIKLAAKNDFSIWKKMKFAKRRKLAAPGKVVEEVVND